MIGLMPNLAAKEPIPPRDPKPGEGRPGWWWSLWLHHIVVFEGEINWDDKKEPEVQVEYDSAKLKAALEAIGAEYVEEIRYYRLGEIKVKKLLFASQGITDSNSTIEDHKVHKFLLPVYRHQYGKEVEYSHLSAMKGDSGVFVFDYESMMVSVPLVYSMKLEKEAMESANAVFEHRAHYNHIAPGK